MSSLEAGAVLYFPGLAFELQPDERRLLTPAILRGAKNVSFNMANGQLGGCTNDPVDRRQLAGLMRRFAEKSSHLLEQVLPDYRGKLRPGRTSLRPAEIAGRVSSWRKDDTRLHVDSFPSTPVQGRRILRVFSNVNPEGRPRSWRLGEPFEEAARRFAPAIRPPLPGSAALLRLFRVTRTRRSLYDHYMLRMHDRMKEDTEYQQTSRQMRFDFPAGSTWVAFTDQVLHAASAGQHQLEQTFYLLVSDMVDPSRAPVRVLERITGRHLLRGRER
jgi:hypothetical protein